MAGPSNYGGNRNEERAPDTSGLRETRVIAINRVAKAAKLSLIHLYQPTRPY